VTLRFIPRDSVRAAALAGWPGITLSRAAGLNTVYVMLATAREEAGPFISLPDGAAPAANPLRDRRVRAALSLALNRAGLAERLLAGAGLPASQFAAIGSREHMDHVTLPAQDLARARALLAEAGYPDGLQIVLHGPSDRFSNIAQVAEAVAQMWARAGVATTVETMPWNIMARRAVRGEFAATVFACCSSTADTLTTTRDLLATQDPARSLGVSNWGRYSNPVLDRVVAAGMVQFDPAERGRAAAQAASIVAEDVPLIPLYHPLNTWAARAPLSFVPRQDGQTPAIGVRRGS
jgi:peptide/nickel transport system substrate-binding protein